MKNKLGQVILEFTFCMIVVFLMIYGLAKIAAWSGKGYADIINKHEETFEGDKSSLDENFWDKDGKKEYLKSTYQGANPAQKE